MEPLLSFVIPFYNVEKYIAQCLDSVYQQDIPEEEYEVICVNDASPDHSRDIVLEYQKKHSNLILVEHEVNKKLGTARNTGRKIARGKYIWNVDSDDMIEPNCLSEILRACDKNELDILCMSYSELQSNGAYEKIDEGLNMGVMSGREFVHQYGCSRLGALCSIWRYVFRKGFLDDNNIYSPAINMGEDVPYSFKSLFIAKKILFLDNMGYVYKLNDNSLTGSKKVLIPEILYEKCFENARLIMEVVNYVPDEDIELKESCRSVAKYTFDLWKSYYRKMGDDNKRAFKTICKKQFRKDKQMLKTVTYRLQYIKYVLWLVGISNI